MRPGDRQPPYRVEIVAKFRAAASAPQRFEQSMRSVKKASGATPAELRALERRVLSLKSPR